MPVSKGTSKGIAMATSIFGKTFHNTPQSKVLKQINPQPSSNKNEQKGMQ